MRKSVVDSLNQLFIYHKTMHRLYLEKLGLFFGQPRLLYQLKCNPGISQKELVEKLGVSKEAISMSVRRLAKKGLLIREVDPEDKRKFNLSLTQAGLEILDEVLIQQNQTYQKLLNPLNLQQQQQLQELVELMNEAAREEVE